MLRRRRSNSCTAACRPAGSRGSSDTIVYSSHMGDVPIVIMRWLHISSMTALIGAMIYGRVVEAQAGGEGNGLSGKAASAYRPTVLFAESPFPSPPARDRKSTRLNSSHLGISYAVFCFKKKKITHNYAEYDS